LSHRGSPAERRFIIGIRSAENGQTREITPAVRNLDLGGGIRWSADGQSLIGAGEDFKGTNGVFRINAQTGQTSAILSGDRAGISMPVESNDGKSIYYRVQGPDVAFIKLDLVSGQETQLIKRRSLRGLVLSPDRRHIATTGDDPAI
jgi:Tol biopolymer transport system component